jgi:hypothetical protein
VVSEFIELRAPCNIDISTKLRFTTLLLRVTIIIKFCKFVLLDIAKSQFLLTRQNQIGGGGRIPLWLCFVIRGTNLKFSDWQF